MLNFEHLKQTDEEVYNAVIAEYDRQQNGIELIASENRPSEAVLEAQASYHALKYAEGYVGKRYYAGCENIDTTEQLAIDRACQLFNAEFANVQPHSGSQANEAVYIACLKKGDKVLTMTLNSGGHITHMSPATAQSRFYEPIYYDVDPETYLIDYDKVEELALKHLPRLIICGASAYPRTIDFSRFREIVDKVNEEKKKQMTEEQMGIENFWEDNKCLLMCDMAHIAGLVATGLHPSPIPYCDFVTSTTHKTLRGTRGGLILCKKEWAKQIDLAVFPRLQGGGLQHIVAAKAVTFKEALQPEFKTYQEQVLKNAKALAEQLIKNGLNVLTGGTDNHLILLDLRGTGITGKELEDRLARVHIVTNKNAIPFDTEKKTITSGLRLGTPAVTSRGMKEDDMRLIANLISMCAKSKEEFELYRSCVESCVAYLCQKYPLY